MPTVTRRKPSKKSKAKSTTATSSPVKLKPPTAEQFRVAIADGENRLAKIPAHQHRFSDKAQKLIEGLDADRRQLELAEVREMPAPAAIAIPFEERTVAITSIRETGNHREKVDEAKDLQLAASIGSIGLQQRIGLRDLGDGSYGRIYGARRVRAARLAGLKQLDAKIYAIDLTAAQVEAIRTAENFGQQQLTPVEMAMAVARNFDAIAETLSPLRDGGGADNSIPSLVERAERIGDELLGRDEKMASAIQLATQIRTAGGIDAYVGQQCTRPAKWVKDHAYVSRLGGAARQLLADDRIDIGHARELAKLGDVERADILAKRVARTEQGLGGDSVEHLRQLVVEELRTLRSVPWELDIAFGHGVPGCTGNACSRCPFNSKSDPDLFGGALADEPDAGFCTNAACFIAKTQIIDREMKDVARRAAPLVKKRAKQVDPAASNPITLSVVQPAIPRNIKPASAVRRLQKDLAHLAEPSAGKPPVAGDDRDEPPQSREEREREESKTKLASAVEKWAADLESRTWDAVLTDKQAYRFLAVLMLELGTLGKELSDRHYGRDDDDEPFTDLAESHAADLDAAIDCRGQGLGILAKKVLEEAAQGRGRNALAYAATVMPGLFESDTAKMAPIFAKLVTGWGGGVPPKPKLEDFLPKRKAAAAPSGSTDGTVGGYEPSHPWYYKLGGKPLAVEAITPTDFSNKDVDLEQLLNIPKKGPSREKKLRAAIRDVTSELRGNVERYESLVSKGWDAITDPPALISRGRDDSSSTLDDALSLKHNHISFFKGKLDFLRSLLSKPIPNSVDGCEVNGAAAVDAAAAEAGGDAFAEEATIHEAADVGQSTARLEAVDALKRVKGQVRVAVTVHSMQVNGKSYVVLGRVMVRGIRCYHLAELCEPTADGIRGTDAIAAAARGDFDGIEVIDAAGHHERRRICATPDRLIYVRAFEPVAGGGQ